jgi:TPR repeat protein
MTSAPTPTTNARATSTVPHHQGKLAGFLTSSAPTGKKAQTGDAGSQNDLTMIYVSGDGVPKDFAKAMKWFRKAAEQGRLKASSTWA